MVIEVWAPHAPRVRLHRPGQTAVELTAGDAGWWHAEVALAAGEEYGFVLGEDDRVLPDPRSRRQPRGVHDLSAWDEPASFAWTDENWRGRSLDGALIYELHVGTFTPEGTLDAISSRFEHLRRIGVTHLELLPVNAFNGTHNWGYDGVLWSAVHEPYGGPEAYRRFVDAAHAAGFAVIQDVVYNHLGPSGNCLPAFGPYQREGNDTTWGASINLDEPAVREVILENALMWLRDFHVDGLRLDAVHALHESGAQPAHILHELSERVDALAASLGRPLSLIAESDLNDPVMILPRGGEQAGEGDDRGHGLTAQWVDDFHHAVHVALTGETSGYYGDFADPEALAKTWRGGFYHDGIHSSFRGVTWGKPLPETLPTWQRVVFAQDHDQIGNRAAGDRLSQTLSPERLRIAALLTLTAPATPMLFMGEEWGAHTPWPFFTSHPEPELAEATRRGRREEFARMGWDSALVPDPNAPETFASARLDWSETAHPRHAELLDFYARLAALRREKPALQSSDAAAVTGTSIGDGRWILGRGGATVYVNLAAEPWEITPEPGAQVWIATDAPEARGAGLRLPPDSAVLLGPGD